jgi:predicted nucleic acid-binding protein
MVILDTNIIIDHLRQIDAKQTIYQKLLKRYSKKSLGISTITIQELFIGQSTRSPKCQKEILLTVSGIKIFAHGKTIARLAGELMRDSKNNLKFADAAIAATAIHYGASLATLNTKDFTGIPHLNLLKLPLSP